ncbi:porin [Marinobacter sp.]|uniref:porin n=1 Tax=Marinobacter sp. TaxID=50741 RepID=UPI0035668AE0
MKKRLIFASSLLSSFPAYSYEIAGTGLDVYGSFRLMMEHQKDGGGSKLKDALSRVGVTGSYDLSDGLSAFAKYEVALDLANDDDSIGDMRYGHIGLNHESYGSAAIGKVDSPLYQSAGSFADYMWWDSAPVYYTLDGQLRIDDAIYLSSANMGGLKVQALHQIGSEEDDVEDISQLGASFSHNRFTFGAGASMTEGDVDTHSLAISYNQDIFYMSASYISKKDQGSGVDALIGVPSGKNLYTLGISDFEAEESDEDFVAGILAYQRTLHEKVLFWAEFMVWDGRLYGVDNSNQVNIGMNFSF